MKNNFFIILLELFAFLIVFFSEIQSALFAVGFLIFIDTFSGLWGAYKIGGIASIHSSKAARIISKFILYPLSIIVAKVAEKYLSPSIPWVDVTCGVLAIIEVKSIFENISIILGFDLWDRVKKLIWKNEEF